MNSRGKSCHSQAGFTFIETLVVLIIFSVVILAVYGVSRGGLEIYRRSQNFDIKERKIVLALERLSEDLRKVIPLHKFEDEIPEELRFYSVTGVGEEKHKLSFVVCETDKLSRLSYIITEETAGSFKLYLIKSDVLEEEREIERNIASGIKKGPLNTFFQYLKYNDISDSYEWVDEWQEEDLPPEVLIEFAYEPEDKDEEAQVFTKRIFILR